MNYYFIRWFALSATHRYTAFPSVRPHQSATQSYIKFSRINGKKESLTKPNHTELHQGKESETSSG